MLDSRERRILPELELTHARHDAIVGKAWLLGRCRIPQQDLGRLLIAARPVAARRGAAARHDELDQCGRIPRNELLDLFTQGLHVGCAEPEAFAALRQALEMQSDEACPAALTGDGLEEPVTVVQAPIERTQLRDRLAVHEQEIGPHAASKTASMPRALARVSSSSRCGSESATMPAPARSSMRPGATVIVRIKMLRSSVPSTPRKPSEPVYAPRPSASSSAMICMQRNLGQPVIVPPGKTARTAPMGDTSGRSRPRTLETMWCTCAYVS